MSPPKGNPTDVFEKGAHQRYADALENLSYQRDMAKKKNLFTMGLVGICVIGTILVTTTMNYKTYVVRVDNTTGQVELSGQLKSTNYVPQTGEIKYFLSQFVEKIRTVPLDPVRFRQDWNTAAQFMSKPAMTKLQTFMRQDNPATNLGKKTVQPTITSMQLYPGTNNTWLVRWTEEDYNLSGSLSSQKRSYVGTFLIGIEKPENEKEVMVNPLGIKIKDLSISVENAQAQNTPVANNTQEVHQ